MTKVNKPGSHKSDADKLKAAEAKKPHGEVQSTMPKAQQSGKKNKPDIGGKATAGAKSTLPREVKTSDPMQQQAESYNRQMRRRMQHLGTGPYNAPQTAQKKRQKRLERKRKRLEEQRQEIKKTRSKIRLGRRVIYFLIFVVAIVLLVIAIAIIVHNPFR